MRTGSTEIEKTSRPPTLDRDLPGLMKEAAGEGMWSPRPCGEGVGTKDWGEGACRWGFPGELAVSSVPGDGMRVADGEGLI